MENWRINHFRHIGGIVGAAAIELGAGGKTNLVVDDNMHRAMYTVATRL